MSAPNEQLGRICDLGELDWELESFVGKFEQAMTLDPRVDVGDFLPDERHARYGEIGCELLRVDMELAAACGRDFSLSQYESRFPRLFEHSLISQMIQAEEARLRKHCNARLAKSGSFLVNGQPAAPVSRMPNQGESVCGFDIVRELGRGAFSRVFLARDHRLSQRPVVIKLSAELPGEAQTLSRLQHKNIVPVYSQHRHGEYHVICMPFLGSMTLADVMKEMDPQGGHRLSGKALVSTLTAKADRTWADVPPSGKMQSAVSEQEEETDHIGLSENQVESLSQMSTTEVALWLISELADGLEHAHERGILHRDVKPANILISDDGLPMLLDFNLAVHVRPEAGSSPLVGGTLRYMSGEQLAAVEDGRKIVDARADVFSLGIVLFELLTRRAAYPDRKGEMKTVAQQMRVDRSSAPEISVDWQQGLTPGVVSIVRRATAPIPANRYQTAGEFRDDLRLQLSHKPLRKANNTSVRERLAKWNARHPRLSAWTIASMAMLVMLVGSFSAFFIQQTRIQTVEAQKWFVEVEKTLSPARSLLVSQNVPGAQVEELLESSRAVLDQTVVMRHLHKLSQAQASEARTALARVHFWRARANWSLIRRQPENDRQWLKKAIQELQVANQYDSSVVSKEWLAILEPLIGDEIDPAQLGRQLRSAFENERQLIEAELVQAKRADLAEAANPWHWLSLGGLQFSVGQTEDARNSFLLCHSLDPRIPLATFYLGILESKRRNFASAEHWYGRCLALKPHWDEAIMNRASVRIELGKYSEALSDLKSMQARMKKLPRSYFIQELALTRLGKRGEAIESRRTGIELEPTDAQGWNARGEARLRLNPPDAAGALSDFNEAIALDLSLSRSYENAAHVLSERLGRPEDALKQLNEVIKLDPAYALAWSSRAVLQARAGNFQQSLADVEQALGLERTPIICYQAASALALIPEKHSNRAIELLKEALRKDVSLAKLMQRDSDLKELFNHSQLQEILAAAYKLQ